MKRLLKVATPLTAVAVAVVDPPAKMPVLSVRVTVDESESDGVAVEILDSDLHHRD